MDKAQAKKNGADPAVRAVFFDIGNVLLDYDVSAALKRFGWAVKRHPIKIAKLLWSRRIVEDVERGRLSGKELHAIFRDELGYPGDYRGFKELFCGPFKLNRKTAGLLKKVGQTRPAYLLSNTNRLHYDFIRSNYCFCGDVKGALLSYRLGLRKPEPAIYEAAAARAKIRPEEAFFVDDLAENVRAARKLGWQAVRYQGADHLEKELNRRGLLGP